SRSAWRRRSRCCSARSTCRWGSTPGSAGPSRCGWARARNPSPAGSGILAGIVITTAIAAVEGLIVVWLRIPSFVVTLGFYLGLNGVLLWLFEQSGSVGLGGVIQDHNGFINGLGSNNLSPLAGWIVLIAVVVVAAVFLIARDRRRRANGLVAPP